MDSFNTAIKDKREYSGLNLKEFEPITKINLRGKKREFFTKVGQALSVILPMESNTSAGNQELSALWLSPDEWMVISNETTKKDSNNYDLEESLYNSISKTNLGAVVDVSDQYVMLELEGSKVYELFSSGSPFNFNEFKEKKGSSTQTLLNGIDVIILNKGINLVNLFVRRSFSEHLYSWINDSASRL